MKKHIQSGLITGILLIVSYENSQGSIFSLSDDWSDSSNPNGSWSYNLNGSLLESHLRGGDIWSTPQQSWVTGEGGHIGWFQSNGTESFLHDWQQGDIITHTPSYNSTPSGYTDVIWTSPINGIVSIDGAAWATRDNGRSNTWEIYLNDTLLSFGQISFVQGRSNPFDFDAGSGGKLDKINLLMGDKIQLRLHNNGPSYFYGYGDYVGVNMEIQTQDSQPVPEPATIILFGTGIVGLAAGRRRKKAS